MKRIATLASRCNRWHLSLFAAALTFAAGGAVQTFSWAQTTTAPMTVPPNHAAALDAFRQARELYGQENYADANTQNNRALQLEPGLRDAVLLRKVLQGKLGDAANTPTPGSGEPGAGGGGGTGAAPKVKPLTNQQISMIRLQELSDTDTQVRGRVSRKLLDTFWNTYVKTQPGSDLSLQAYNMFVSPNNFAGQVHAIKGASDPKYSENLEITSDPVNIIPFRTTVQPYILQNCATAACHGGDKAGNFHLLRPGAGSTDSVIYTDFYILSRYATKDGGKMLNRDEPDKSLFLQYGLPKTIAQFSHPGTADVRPRFGDASAGEYRAMVDWVKTLAYPQPNYGLVYEIPGMAPSTMPAPASPGPTTKPAVGRSAPARAR